MEEKEVKQINEDEVEIIQIVQKLWRNRKFIVTFTAIFAILGLIVSVSTPNVYTASCTMVPQTVQKNTGGSLSGLAAIAGINLGSLGSGESLPPTVYPIILTNINFQKELIYSKFHFNGVKEAVTLYEYYTNKKYQKFSLKRTIRKYTIGLPNIIISAIKGNKKDNFQSNTTSLQTLTSKEQDVVKIVNANLILSIFNKEGYISLIANMTEPLLAAELAQKGQELLQKYISEFKIEKVANNLKFVETSYEESKRNFESKQVELARFRDSNKSFTSAVAKTQEEKLISEYTLLLSIYTELAKQREQAKIAINETTPILTVIDPVFVPVDKSNPSRILMISVYMFLGFVLGIGIVISVPYIQQNLIPGINKYRLIPKIL